jgi:hypothetical protein
MKRKKGERSGLGEENGENGDEHSILPPSRDSDDATDSSGGVGKKAAETLASLVGGVDSAKSRKEGSTREP